MDHSLAVRQNTERIWNIRRGETGSRRNRRRVHHCMSFRERRKIRYTLELLRILEAACSSMHSDDDRSGNIVDRNDTSLFW